MMDDSESNERSDPGSLGSGSLAEREQLSEGRPDEEPAEAPVAAGAVESGHVVEESPPTDGKPPIEAEGGAALHAGRAGREG